MVYLSDIRNQTSPPYVRPTEWLTLPTIDSTTQAIHLLKAVMPGNNFFTVSATTSSGNFTVDFGDGNTNSYVSGTTVSYNYNYSSINSNTEFRGYRQVIIIITGNILTLNLSAKHSSTATNIPNESGILELQLRMPAMTGLTFANDGSTTGQMHKMIEVANIGANSLSSAIGMFRGCAALAKVIFSIPSNSLSFSRLFQDCTALQEISFVGDTSGRVNSLWDTFSGCSSLVKAPWLNTSAVTLWDNTFINCISLEYVPLYNKTGGNFSSLFSGCRSLKSVPPLNASSATSFLTAFNGCSQLRSIPLFNTANVTNFQNAFNGCSSLTTIPSLNTSAATNMQGMFTGCVKLRTIPQLTTNSVTNMSSMFNNCDALESIPQLNMAAVTNASSMFNGAEKINTIPSLNTAAVTNASSMFATCRSLRNIPSLNFAAVSSPPNSANIFQNCNSLSVGATSGIRFAISYINCQLSQSELVAVFNGLGTASGSQTITITGNPGAASLTSEERAIATGKGWTITG